MNISITVFSTDGGKIGRSPPLPPAKNLLILPTRKNKNSPIHRLLALTRFLPPSHQSKG